MIVGLCHAVPDTAVRAAAAAGYGPEEIAHETHAGTSCGCCSEAIARIVAESHRCRRHEGQRCVGCRH